MTSQQPPDDRLFDRRAFLRGAGRAASYAALASTALAACDMTPQERAARASHDGPTGLRRRWPEPPQPGDRPLSVGGVSLRPPAVPLAVRDPYVSAWLQGTDLAAEWAAGWDGSPMSVCGLVRVDRETYRWCGGPEGLGLRRLRQTSLEITPTRSSFTLEGGGIRLVAEWLSPVEPGDTRLQSVPLSLLTVAVSSVDGRAHDVSLYCDIGGEWASWEGGQEIAWETHRTAARHWSVHLASERPLSEQAQMAEWGSAVFSTPARRSTSYESGAAASVRASFAAAGRLSGRNDPVPQVAQPGGPVFALAHRLGSVGREPALAEWSLGHVESPAVEYMGRPLEPLWKAHWESWQKMADEFLGRAAAARARAIRLDETITSSARVAGGPEYAALCALALRQAYGGCQLVVGPAGRPWAFLKELSSDGDISTVDIIFDTCPVFFYLDPGFVPMLLEPVLHYAASDRWSKRYPPHSLGFWPIADGNPVGPSAEPMPVWESGALLTMAAVWADRVPGETARAFLARYEPLWARWAALLISELPSPPAQLTTIDYLGHAPHDTNLAVLGIVGLGAAGRIASRLGKPRQAANWAEQAAQFSARWAQLAADPSGQHLESHIGWQGTWSNLCNAYWDAVLRTGLVSAEVSTTEAAWYRAKLDKYGLPVASNTPQLARLDQQLITAAWLHDQPVGPELIQTLARYVDHTDFRAPLPDTYDPTDGEPLGLYKWRGRPVVGAAYGLLLLKGPLP